MKTQERLRARELRSSGCSVRKIAAIVGVSTSSVCNWTKDVILTSEQQGVLFANKGGWGVEARQRRATSSLVAKCRTLRNEWQREGKELALKNQWLHVAGCMLYWGEGTKARNVVALGNSDPQLLRLFLLFLRTYFDVQDRDIALTINAFDDGPPEEEIRDFWLRLFEMTTCKRLKVYFNRDKRQRSGKKTNKHRFGICKIEVYSTRIVQHIYGGIQEYGWFKRESMAD